MKNKELNIIAAWSFNTTKYENLEDFKKELIDYNEVLNRKYKINLDEIVLENPRFDLSYRAWLVGPEDLLENDELCEDDDFWENEDNSDGDHFQAEIFAKFTAINNKNFTAAEILFQIHNQFANKELGDHTFFEGLTQYESDDDIPSFYIHCGS